MLMSIAKSGEPNETPRYAAYGQVLHCLSMSHKKDASLQLVNTIAIGGSRLTKAQTDQRLCYSLIGKYHILSSTANATL